jgi:hypothetical protein
MERRGEETVAMMKRVDQINGGCAGWSGSCWAEMMMDGTGREIARSNQGQRAKEGTCICIGMLILTAGIYFIPFIPALVPGARVAGKATTDRPDFIFPFFRSGFSLFVIIMSR